MKRLMIQFLTQAYCIEYNKYHLKNSTFNTIKKNKAITHEK